MVLSTTKKTASMSSIINQNQGGGSKKAGLVPLTGVTNWSHSADKQRSNYGNLKAINMHFKMTSSQNLPVGFNHGIRMH
jgi:hypothetical protein